MRMKRDYTTYTIRGVGNAESNYYDDTRGVGGDNGNSGTGSRYICTVLWCLCPLVPH